MRAALVAVLAACAAAPPPAPAPAPPPAPEPAAEHLVVFVQETDDTAAARRFAERELEGVRRVAGELGLETLVRDVAGGAPEPVAITPLIVYANHRGRAVYQGRTTTLDRLRAFVQTARVIPQGAEPHERADLPVWRAGRARVGAPIKITALSGARPEGFDEDAFRTDARAAIDRGLERFETVERAAFGRADRLFYVDFHPYRREDGTLFLSTALFSQFHCHEPIAVSGQPFRGAWAERDDLFAAAAKDLERRIVETVRASTRGDGFVPVPDSTPIVTWEALGLALPERPGAANAADAAADFEVPLVWTAGARAGAADPPVRFAFLDPLDAYTGRARELTARLALGEGGRLDGAGGFFEVRCASVTMGEPDLDDFIHGAAVLDVARHPAARFTIERVSAERDTLPPATVVPATLHGRFGMKGIEVPLDVPAQLEVVIGADGRPRLHLDATWHLDILEPFGIDGPDGPPEAARIVVLSCQVELEQES